MSAQQRSFGSRCISLICLLVAAGCSRALPTPPSADEIIAKAAQRMKSLPSFHFVLDSEGSPAFLDTEETLAFGRAEGDFVAPDQARATIRVILPGLVAEVKVVAIGDDYWETNVLSGEWQKLPPGVGFNPAFLFDPKIGFHEILYKDVEGLRLTGMDELEDLPGLKLYALSGMIKAENLYKLSFGMLGPEPVQVKIWVASDTYEVYRVELIEVFAAKGETVEDSTIWQVDFWDFGVAEPVEPPAG